MVYASEARRMEDLRRQMLTETIDYRGGRLCAVGLFGPQPHPLVGLSQIREGGDDMDVPPTFLENGRFQFGGIAFRAFDM